MSGLTRREQEQLARDVEQRIKEYEQVRDTSGNPDERAEYDKEIVSLRRALNRWKAGHRG